MNTNPSKILRSVGEICEYLQIGKDLFYKLVKLGMPVRNAYGSIWAHTENLDIWFKELTWTQETDLPEDS